MSTLEIVALLWFALFVLFVAALEFACRQRIEQHDAVERKRDSDADE